ncbi:hypothetical protein VTJ49DRAFT_6511 [Mycothermus thermophilus]|uniref:CENP-V/GFA domain-containing protein n=1 Tax=Humicola insolens TaxID=85995 RepID=A0ABR3VJ63_HUMIN
MAQLNRDRARGSTDTRGGDRPQATEGGGRRHLADRHSDRLWDRWIDWGDGNIGAHYVRVNPHPAGFNDFAAKFNITTNPFRFNPIAREERTLRAYRDALHVINLRQHPPVVQPPQGQAWPQADIQGARNQVLLLEHLERGTLEDALNNIYRAQHANPLRGRRADLRPDGNAKVLWHIFLCLVKSLEQFSEEWDYLPPGSSPYDGFPIGGNNRAGKVAGNYGWRTNLFQIGLVMMCLITCCVPPRPPYPSRIWVPDCPPADQDDDDLYDNEPRQQARPAAGDAQLPQGVQDHDHGRYPQGRPGWLRVWSWGGFLLHTDPLIGWAEFTNAPNPPLPPPPVQRPAVHEDLCRLVAWCLCDDPHYRPRLRVLEREIKSFMEAHGPSRKQPNNKNNNDINDITMTGTENVIRRQEGPQQPQQDQAAAASESSTDNKSKSPPAPSSRVTYRGNCHCAAFVYEVKLPTIHSALECRCAMCHRKGYLWNLAGGGRRDVEVVKGKWEDLARYEIVGEKGRVVHRFCPKCATPVMAEVEGGNNSQEGTALINVRALQGVDTWTIEKVPYSCPAASALAAATNHTGPLPTPIDGNKPYTASCHCGAVTLALTSKPLDSTYPEATVDCNCSVCVRNGYIWAYPLKHQVVLWSRSPTAIGRYHFSHHVLNKTFCTTCGVCLTNEWAGRSEEELRALGARLPTPAKMIERMSSLHPVNLRVFPDVDLGVMKPPYLNKGATGIPPAYVNP